MATPLFIPATYYDGPNQGPILIPYVDVLPTIATQKAVILAADVGTSAAGMYVYTIGIGWRFAMPIEAVSAIIVGGDGCSVYVNVTTPITLGPTSIIYSNGQLQTGHDLQPSTGVYAVRLPSSASLGQVTSVNGLTGDVVLNASNISGFATVAYSGDFNDLLNKPTAYVLPPATTTTLGGVIVPVSSNLAVDGSGNISVAPALLSTISGKIGSLSSAGIGVSVIDSQGAGSAALRSMVAGANMTITSDGAGGLVFASSGGVSSVTLTGDVTGSGTGTVPTLLSNTGVAAGTYKSVTVDLKGRVTAGTNPTTLAGFGITDALALTGGSMTGSITMTTGSTVTGVPNPTHPLDAANQQYVDAAIAAAANGVFWKASVQAATTANISLTGLQTIDGYTTLANDRVLVKDQTNPVENGIYVAASGAWTRSTDTDSGAEIFHAAVLILNGTANGLAQWTNTNATTPVVGTDPITWGQLKGAANVYVAGAGLQLVGLTFSIAPTGVGAGTYTKVTVNTLGQVTAATNLLSSDITAALGYTPYNGTTNPNGYIGTSSPINITGDATGTGTTAISLTLANSGVTAGTYTKVTVDAKGRVTVGANLSSAEIAAALGYTPVNRAGDTMTGALNFATAVTVPSASSTPIGAAAANDVTVSGTTTINSFDTVVAGAHRTVMFSGILTLTNSAGLQLPTGANILTAAGDVAEFVSLGGGTWRCNWYSRASGQALTGAPDATKLPLAGGTMTGALNNAAPATLASAATVNIGAAAANDITITGTAAISAFDTILAGAHRTLTFTGAATLTHNAVSMILPTGANILTAAGDVAEFVSLGGGNWKCEFYQRANGAALGSDPTKLSLSGGTMTGALNNAAPVTIAATATVNIGAAAANDITISGSTTITAFDTVAAGVHRTLTFTGTPTLTYNATSLILPGAANVVAAVGDVAEFVSLGGGNWRCEWYTRASGSSGSPYTTTQVFNGSAAVEAAKFTNVAELAAIIAAAPAATENFYIASGAVQFHTVAATANFILNFAHSAGTPLNTAMAVGDSITVALLVTNGATPFFPNTFRIDGTGVTPKWQGGVAPSSGNASAIDVYSFTIIKTAAATFTVLGAQTQFK